MKTNEILNHLRSRIVQGEFLPGDKLPTRPALLREYSVSVAAFQKCINKLIDWQFLESRGVKGMCVTANPPHLSHFAILMPTLDDSFLWVFEQAVAEYARENPHITFRYFQVGRSDAPDRRVWDDFVAQAELGLLAGAIGVLLVPPADVRQRLGDFPCVVVSRSRHDTPHPYPDILFDTVGLFRRQLELLQARGCRNVAALVHSYTGVAKLLELVKVGESGAVHCPRRWIQGIHLENTRGILYDNLLDLILDRRQAEVPDGLVVQNENFLPLVLSALSRHNLVPGVDIRIVSHCNIPVATPRINGIDYVGFDNGQTVREAFRLLAEWRKGSLFEREVTVTIPPSPIAGTT